MKRKDIKFNYLPHFLSPYIDMSIYIYDPKDDKIHSSLLTRLQLGMAICVCVLDSSYVEACI